MRVLTDEQLEKLHKSVGYMVAYYETGYIVYKSDDKGKYHEICRGFDEE